MLGGLALKNTKTRRYEKDEFYKLAELLIPEMEEVFQTEVALVKSYHTKESFGDMDLLILDDGRLDGKDIREKIDEIWSPNEIVRNDKIFSFDINELQIDLIWTPIENWETSQVFFAYNDLGNLMGKLFHKFGLKYGFNGVTYIYNIENKRLGEITITKDMKEAFEFLRLDWNHFERGFEDLEEIFNYVISSPYFSAESFYLENLNATNRRRNIRRKVYNQFIQYVNRTGEYSHLPKIEKSFDWNSDKSVYWQIIDQAFPTAKFFETQSMLIDKAAKEQERRSKFNGKLVMDKYPNLSGKDLGDWLIIFERSMSNNKEEFDEYLDKHSSEEIMMHFDNVYNPKI